MSEEVKTIEVAAEPEVKEVKSEVITRSDLKSKGWSKQELDSAEKRGMISKPEVKDAEEKPQEKVVENEAKTEVKPEIKEERSSLPDFTINDPEKERVFLETFGAGTPQRAMYFRMKNERQSRQRAEAERDRLLLEKELWKDSTKPQVENQTEVDENGNVIDPEDKPLTMKQLKAMQQQEMEKLNQQKVELEKRSVKVSEAMKSQEEYAKAILPDFDETVKLATELVNNLDLVPDPWKKSKIVKLIKDLQVTAATADQHGIEDYTASMIAYELGQLHPKYGHTSDDNGKADPKANGSLTPEQMKRIEENTQRRASSASLPGSSNGRRTISIGEITVKDILKMTPEERHKFKRDHPEKMKQLLRG